MLWAGFSKSYVIARERLGLICWGRVMGAATRSQDRFGCADADAFPPDTDHWMPGGQSAELRGTDNAPAGTTDVRLRNLRIESWRKRA
jgi:hypothetical protein